MAATVVTQTDHALLWWQGRRALGCYGSSADRSCAAIVAGPTSPGLQQWQRRWTLGCYGASADGSQAAMAVANTDNFWLLCQ